MSRRAALGLAAAVALALAAGALLLWRGGGGDGEGGSTGRISLAPGAVGGGGEPSPGAAAGDAGVWARADSAALVDSTDFVGAEACGECHEANYRDWRASTHGTAGGLPGSGIVVAPFDGAPLRFADATVRPLATPGGGYAFEVAWQGETVRLDVDAVVGRGHMVGGGTQGFLAREPDGTLRLLPFDFSVTGGRWFCNTAGRADRGWVPVGPELRLADCTDWPPTRALGQVPRYTNCQNCHGSQIRVEIRRGAPRYDTRFASLRVDCESCHGPGREHVALARAGRIGPEEGGGPGLGLDPLAAPGEEGSLEVCFRCHALKDALRGDYLPGRPLEEHYALKFPILGDRPYTPDGRIRTFAYQETHLFADCYLNGTLACVDCHEPHGGGYRDVDGRPLEGRFADGQCTGCHASKAERPELHTHHPPASDGARCVACHMPYLQEPAVGEAIRYARSDHTIPVPRPASDAALGVVPACATCHEDRPVEALQAQTERWWGELKPRPPLVTGLIEARDLPAGARTAGRAAPLVLRPDEDHPMAQFAGLAWLVEEVLGPDMPELDGEARRRLERLARADDRDVAALALAALHLARGQDPEVRRFLAERLEAAGRRDADGDAGEAAPGAGTGGSPPRDGIDEEASLRARWAVALGHMGDRYREAGRTADALAAYAKALEVRPDDPDLHFAAGVARAGDGRLREAIADYDRSLALEPDRPLVHVNRGIALAALGRAAAAAAAYRRAAELDPHEELAWFNLGNLHLRAREPGPAIEAYRRALEAAPGLAPAWFNLTRALALAGRPLPALEAVRRGLAYDPADASGLEMRRALERALEEG